MIVSGSPGTIRHKRVAFDQCHFDQCHEVLGLAVNFIPYVNAWDLTGANAHKLIRVHHTSNLCRSVRGLHLYVFF